MPRTVRLRSRAAGPRDSRTLVSVTPRQAGWKYVRFAVRQIAARDRWKGSTGSDEACLVLLEGRCHVASSAGVSAVLGPRPDVFSGYSNT